MTKKIQVLSDLHLEFFISIRARSTYGGEGSILKDRSDVITEFLDDLFDNDSDIVVIPGDYSAYPNDLKFLNKYDKQFVFVFGNHEFYGSDINIVHSTYRNTCPSNFHILDKSSFEVDNIVFLGGTLWTDTPTIEGSYRMNDFRYIEGMNLDYWKRENASTLSFIDERLHNKEQGKKYIVVSHHGPSLKSMSFSRHRIDGLTSMYLNSNAVENHYVNELKPDLWIYGHTHESCDYDIDETRIIANCFGYKDHDEDPKFVKHKIIEI